MDSSVWRGWGMGWPGCWGWCNHEDGEGARRHEDETGPKRGPGRKRPVGGFGGRPPAGRGFGGGTPPAGRRPNQSPPQATTRRLLFLSAAKSAVFPVLFVLFVLFLARAGPEHHSRRGMVRDSYSKQEGVWGGGTPPHWPPMAATRAGWMCH